MSEANRDDAMKCLDIARAARAEGNLTKAKKFAEKAKALYPCAEVDGFLRSVQGGTSSSYQAPSAPNTRQRTAAGASATPSNGTAAPQAAASTPAQREMVKRIRASRGDFYKVLGVERDASDADIKKAYKKLALKVHPDRCSAPGSEEAFKEVSKAFQCLTDPHKRAYYDRTGHEDRASASAAAAASRGGGGGGGYGGGGYQDLDPEQLFNMMFGGGGLRGFGMGPMHFGGFPQGHPRRAAQQRRQQQQHPGGAQEEQSPGFAGSLPLALRRIARGFARLSPTHKLMLLGLALKVLPFVFSLVALVFWALVLGAPVWLLCREVASFERRPVYAPLRRLAPVRNAVRGVRPYATGFLGFTDPFAAVVGSAGRVFLEWAKSMAAM